MDRDSGKIRDTHDFIGRTIIKLSDCSWTNTEEPVRPKWHPLKQVWKDSQPVEGQILVSFNFSYQGASKMFSSSLDKIRLEPKTSEY